MGSHYESRQAHKKTSKLQDRISIRETTPVRPLIGDSPLFHIIHEIFAGVKKARGQTNIIKYHQDRLGKESYLISTYGLSYVWDKPNYRLFVSNFQGLSLEVDTGSSDDQIRRSIQSYIDDIGLNLNVQNY